MPIQTTQNVTGPQEQTDRESQPAYWLKELVTEVRTLNTHLANIDSRLDALAQAAWNRV